MSYVTYSPATKSEFKNPTGFPSLAKLNLITILLHKLLICTVYQTAFNQATKALLLTLQSIHSSSIHCICFWHLCSRSIFKIASQLNSYRNFIDICMKEGQALVTNAIGNFSSPLVCEDHISLIRPNFQKLKDNINHLRSRYGYNYLFRRCTTV
jgi:hypothetical protein